jgi:hypothetical protein
VCHGGADGAASPIARGLAPNAPQFAKDGSRMIQRQRRTGKLHTGFASPGCPFLRQISEGAMGSLQFFERRKDFVSNSRHKAAVLHLRDKDELFVFVNAHKQRIEPVGTENVTANDELLLSIRSVLDPRA